MHPAITPRVRVALAVAAAAALAPAALGQLLNGSFEVNTATATLFDMSHASYNATVANSTSFGPRQQVDLVTTTGFGGVTPIDGAWMVGLAIGGPNMLADQITLTLAAPLVVSGTYTVWWAARTFPGYGGSTLSVGTSGSATSMGNVLATVTPATSGWTLYSSTFTATSPDLYVSFGIAGGSAAAGGGGYIFVDRAALTPTPGAAALLWVGGLAAARRRR